MKFTLISEDIDMFGDKNGDKTTKEFQAIDLQTVLDNVKEFLLGSGFIVDGEIEVIEDDDEDYNFDSEPTIETFGGAQPAYNMQDGEDFLKDIEINFQDGEENNEFLHVRV